MDPKTLLPAAGDEGYGSNDSLERFADVLSLIDLYQIPGLVLSVRIRQMGHYESVPNVGEVKYGSYNILFPLGWILRVPTNGARWDARSMNDLMTETLTIQVLKRETTMLVPDVDNLSIAAHETAPWTVSGHGIFKKMVEEISKIIGSGVELDFWEIILDIED
jgi:hypothetical protein